MPEYCTCGTQLVADARFCHRCGRPTSEFSSPEEAEAPPPIPAPELAQAALQARQLQAKLSQLPVSFSNPVALRVAFLMSLAIIPVELTPVLNALILIWWLAAGWCAVLLYRKLTGSVLSVGSGARLGSIAGVLTFVSLAIAITIKLLFDGKDFFDQMDLAAKKNPDAAQMIHDPAFMFVALLFGLGILGAIVVATCAAGGALGARFTARKVSS
jgi:hypothetical protein